MGIARANITLENPKRARLKALEVSALVGNRFVVFVSAGSGAVTA
jgi:hypothetical protein